MNNQQVGKYGETLAARWLSENGFEILLRNWKYERAEIDIVARKQNRIHAIEVKTRKTTTFGFPEQSVSQVKLRHLQRACTALLENNAYSEVQIDVLSILLRKSTVQYLLLENICGYEL
jgi:putative endonuclease